MFVSFEFGLAAASCAEFGSRVSLVPVVPVGDVVLLPEVPAAPDGDVVLLPEVPEVPELGVRGVAEVPGLPFDAPLQLALIIRTDVTRICGIALPVSTVPEVPATPRRDERDARVRSCTTMPLTSTC